MKKNLIRSIAFHMGEKATQKDADAALQAVVTAVSDALVTRGAVRIAGLGTFKVRVRKARTARNPRTGEAVQVPETATLVFSPDVRAKKTAYAAHGFIKLARKEGVTDEA